MTDVGFAEGRYLYCVVDAGGRSPDPDGTGFAPEGIEGGEPYLVEADGVGAVVQPRGEPFDSDDLRLVKRWLLAHQRVVDAAGEAFGTPLPFRFDTIHRGDDDAVRGWLTEAHGTLREHLAAFDGKWEYRVSLSATGEFDPDDADLADLRDRIGDAGEGEAFLLEKRVEQRRRDLERERDEHLAGNLRERLEPHVADVESADGSGVLGTGDGEDRVASLALLADRASESTVGAELDEVAADPAVEVEFTGPWPPYSFAPELGGER